MLPEFLPPAENNPTLFESAEVMPPSPSLEAIEILVAETSTQSLTPNQVTPAQDLTQLNSAESIVMRAAVKLRKGRHTKEQKLAFRSALEAYKVILAGEYLPVFEHEIATSTEGKASEKIINLLLGSKERIINEGAFRLVEESLLEKARFTFSQNKKRRVLGSLAIVCIVGGSGYALKEGIEALPILGTGLLFAVKARSLAKVGIAVATKHASDKSKSSINKYKLETVREAINKVATIPNEDERKRALLAELNKVHLEDAELELYRITGKGHIVPGEVTPQVQLSQLIDSLTQSIAEVYDFSNYQKFDSSKNSAMEAAAKVVDEIFGGSEVVQGVVSEITGETAEEMRKRAETRKQKKAKQKENSKKKAA